MYAGRASTTSSSISLVKTIIGAGLLSMPLAFSTDGLVFGVLIILLAGVSSGYGLFLQCYVSLYVTPGSATFFNLCQITYPALLVAFDVAIAVQCFGCAISYLVLIADLMPQTIPLGTSDDRSLWLLLLTLICVPLSFLKNLDSLKYTSIMGLIAIGYLTLLVVAHLFVGLLAHIPEKVITLVPQSLSAVFLTFSIIVFAFTGHQNMFSIINESKDRSLGSLSKLVFGAILLSASLFILVGVTGYLTFGQAVAGNVVLSYPKDDLSALIGRASIAFMVIFLFPLMIHPARISVNNVWFWMKRKHPNSSGESASLLNDPEDVTQESGPSVPFPDRTFYIITTALLLVGYTFALTVKSFALVLAIVGATGSTAILFILPGLFGWKLIGLEHTEPTFLERSLKNASLVLVYWGFAVMVLCLYVSLTEN